MSKSCSNSLLMHYEETYSKLHVIRSLLNVIKFSCKDREFKGNYYNIPPEKANLLSDERNEYINILEIISDKVSDMINTYSNIESDIYTSYNNTPTIAADK